MKSLATAIVAFLVVAPQALDAAAYIKFDGIDGESQAPGRGGWIEIESFSWGAASPSNSCHPGGPRPVSASELTIVKQFDKSSPQMMKTVMTAWEPAPLLVMEFDAVVGDGSVKTYLQIKLSDVLVSNYSTGGSNQDRPTESFSLSFSAIRYTYFRYDAAGKFIEVVTEGAAVCDGAVIPPPGVPGTPVSDSFTISDSLGDERTVTAGVVAE